MTGWIGIVLVAVAAAAVDPSMAQTVQKVRKIGFLSVYSESDAGSRKWHRTFEQGLGERGWAVGRDIIIEHRWIRDRRECRVAGRRACVPGLVDELLGLGVELIVVHGGFPARAIRRKSKTIPVVMAEASDAVGRGIIDSLARPGGNITGLTSITPVLAAKRLEILREIVPGIDRVAVLWTPEAPAGPYAWKQIQEPAHRMGLRLYSLELRRSSDLAKAFDQAVAAGAQAIVNTSGVASVFDKKAIVALATRSRLPAIFINKEETQLGGLISYARDNNDLYRRAAGYVDKILRGAKPADLPVEQPTKFEIVVNLKTARAIGLTIPRSILLRADEVIE